MTQATPSDLLVLRQQVTQAVTDQNLAAASELLASLPPAGDAQLDQIAARIYMATQQWASAAQMLARLDQNDLNNKTQLNLARNLQALRLLRPSVYETLVHTPSPGHHALHRMPNGELTVARSRPDSNPLLLCTGQSPSQAAGQGVKALEPAMDKANAIGLNGVGDGYLFLALAQSPSTLLLNKTHAVHLFEPCAELLMQTMMIHDYTGPSGPIEQARFNWHVGPQWQQAYEAAMLGSTHTLPEPVTIAQLSGDQDQLTTLLKAVQDKGQTRNDRVKARIDAYYETYTAAQFKALCSPKPPRQPRVLLVTSRFTSVLQHETARIAAAFEEQGWQTEIAIEPDNHLRLITGAMHQIVDRFKPDLFFTLDHLRHEQGDAVPANLPYCCWVQDLLPNITNTYAGRSVGKNDWVISFCTPLLTTRHQYPADRCIDAPIMMASEPTLPENWENDGPDLAYVSNLSQDAKQMIAMTLKAALPEDQPLVQICCDRIVSHYKQGKCLPSKTDIGSLITPIIQEKFQHTHSQKRIHEIVRNMIDVYWNPLNIGLYRQQALGWIAQIADEQKLSLAIFGNGWENHTQFAAYARGPIHPGEPLQQLVRSTKINLNLEPYPCTTHVRLLDGLTAGGFYLVRHHPANTLLPKLAAFIETHAPQANNDAQAEAMTPAEHQPTLRDLLSRTQGVSYDHPADVVAQMRCYQQAQVMHEEGALLPGLDDITFDDFKSCRERITAFVSDAVSRKTLRDKQHAMVSSRLTLRHGLSRIISFMHDTAGVDVMDRESDDSQTSTNRQYTAISA